MFGTYYRAPGMSALEVDEFINQIKNSQQWNLVNALWLEIPKLVYAFWTLQPVEWVTLATELK